MSIFITINLLKIIADKGFSEVDINTAKEMLYDDTIEEYEWYKKEYKNMERYYVIIFEKTDERVDIYGADMVIANEMKSEIKGDINE